MGSASRILVVDDEANARVALGELLVEEGYAVETAADAFKALGKLDDFGPHLILTDLKLPGMDGIEFMRKALERDSSCPVVVMTAFGAVETAVEAMRAGAVDYLTKPLNFDELALVVTRELSHSRVRDEAAAMRVRLAERDRMGKIVGSSEPMRAVFEMIRQVAASKASVLITGESGTGKELVAAAIHEHSKRADGPFAKVHCAALAETLLESELFGHERGSFTGAVARRDGRFQTAHGGTLFLDEIGEISASTQVKLLRFLQEHEFERVGSSETVRVDVRIVAATNRDLPNQIESGRFREDLYYRLNVITIDMPPLRDRPSDIPLLAQHFLTKYCAENEKSLSGFSPEAMDTLQRYYWPGNVRELENAVERSVVMARGESIERADLPPTLRDEQEPSRGDVPPIPGASMFEIEKFAILSTLEQTGGATKKAADILGISTRKIQYRLQEYNASPKSDIPAVSDAGAPADADSDD